MEPFGVRPQHEPLKGLEGDQAVLPWGVRTPLCCFVIHLKRKPEKTLEKTEEKDPLCG